MAPPTAPRKLKVLHTMTWLAPGGGADTNVYLSLVGLAETGRYDLHFSVGREIFHNEFEHLPGLTLHYCPHLERPVRLWRDIKSIWYYYRLMRRERFDVVHTHEAKASLISRVAGWLARTPVVVFGLHGVAYNDPAFGPRKRKLFVFLERLTVPLSHHIVSVSQACVDCYQADGIGKNIPYEVAYSGIDVERFLAESALEEAERAAERAKLGFGPNDVVLVNVGRFAYGKAQRYTIEAFARLKTELPNLKLLLVGEGELKEQCQQQARNLGLGQDVVFYGYTPNVPRVLALADINVLTSMREGLPRVVVEASLCGLPTAAFDVEGLREIIQHEVSGHIVPQADVAGLAACIAMLAANPRQRQAFAEKARQHAIRNWDFRQMVRQIDAAYQRLARQRIRGWR